MNRLAGRSLVVLAVATALCCGGRSTAPPPSASPSTEPGDSTAALPPGHPPIGGAPPPGAATTSAGAVAGTITVSRALQDRLAPSDVLYVMAKKDGATVAVRRIESPRFPLTFEISGSDAMVAGTGFDGPVDVVARLSKTGDAIPSAGDLEGSASGVSVPAEGVAVTIDRVRQ